LNTTSIKPFGELANVERGAGACLTAQYIGPGPRFRALVALIGLRGASKALLKDFNAFATFFGKLGAKRNRFAHDPWAVEGDHVERLTVTADKHLKYDFQVAPLQELTSFYDEVIGATHQFDELWQRALSELPPWPRKQYEQSQGIQFRPVDRRTDG
jgi:hypothetical protein